MGVFHLRVGVPDFWPLPWQGQELAGDVPQGIAFNHSVVLRVAVFKQCFGVSEGAGSSQQQGDECFPHARNPFIMCIDVARPRNACKPLWAAWGKTFSKLFIILAALFSFIP